jgi:hypothetical protein
MKLSVARFAFLKTALATFALGGFLFLAGAPAAKAYDRDDCYRRVNYTEMRYRQAVERFGPYSREARHWAHERHEAYERCRAYWR